MRLTNHNGDTPLDLGLKETQSFRYLPLSSRQIPFVPELPKNYSYIPVHFLLVNSIYIVTCQRDGVSYKPPMAPGSDKTRGQGSFNWSVHRWNLVILPKEIKKEERTVHWTRFTKGEPGTSQYICNF